MDAVLKNITAIVGAGNVLTGDDVGARRVDWLTGTPCRAGAIVRPGSTTELAAVMRACHAANQPVVIHGGLTGLVHGAEAAPEELAISLERMTAIEAVDPVGGTLTVQAGAPLQRVQEAAAESGMHFALDLGARGSCTIGGNIATNAGGIRVIRHGMMRDQVLGLEAVLADGTVVSAMNRMLKNNAGYDLKQLFIGSEGTLGIITRAVLRLQPQQSATQTAMVSCDDFCALTGLLQHMRHTLGEQLGAFEVMWRNHYALLTDESGRHSPPLPPDAAYYVLIEALGHHHAETTQRFEAAIETAFDAALLTNAVVASSEHQRRRLWAIREDIEGLLHHLNPRFTFDISLPIPDMNHYVQALERAVTERWPEGRIVVFGHLGDGNLHVTVATGRDDDATRRAVEALVYEPLAALDGSISAEHGIGLEKRDYLYLTRSPAEIAVMRTLKGALDPKALLNRHKVLPDAAP